MLLRNYASLVGARAVKSGWVGFYGRPRQGYSLLATLKMLLVHQRVKIAPQLASYEYAHDYGELAFSFCDR